MTAFPELTYDYVLYGPGATGEHVVGTPAEVSALVSVQYPEATAIPVREVPV